MKPVFHPVLLAALVAPAAAQQAPFQTEALLIGEDGQFQRVWITAATKTSVRYRETEQASDTKDTRISGFASIYLMEPREYTNAVDLFQARKYEEAKAAFAAIKERWKPISALRNNHHTLAAFHEMECMRKLGDYAGLAAALASFDKNPLTRESQLRQVEFYAMWEALHAESWDRLEILARQKQELKLPGNLLAQAAYCHGRALEALERKTEALKAYNIAVTADTGSSEIVARDAAIGILRIHHANPDVQTAIKLWGTPDENPNSQGRFLLEEAASVAELYKISLGAGKPLPKEYEAFLRFKPGT